MAQSVRKGVRRVLFTSLAALGLFAIFIAASLLTQPSYHGHPAEYWLRLARTARGGEALVAFHEMGPRADEALIAGFRARETLSHRILMRLRSTRAGKSICESLPKTARDIIDEYLTRGQGQWLEGLPWDSQTIVRSNNWRGIVPKLLPLLGQETNLLTRAAILGAIVNQIGPDNVTGAQLRPLSITARDPWPTIRLRTAICLARAGSCASNELLTIRQLCGDSNASVRMVAAWTQSRLTSKPEATALLETALKQWAEGGDALMMGWEVYSGEGDELKMRALPIPIAAACLTNASPIARGNVCLGLGHEPSLTRAMAPSVIPILKNLLDDPDSRVRKHARSALEGIEPAKN